MWKHFVDVAHDRGGQIVFR